MAAAKVLAAANLGLRGCHQLNLAGGGGGGGSSSEEDGKEEGEGEAEEADEGEEAQFPTIQTTTNEPIYLDARSSASLPGGSARPSVALSCRLARQQLRSRLTTRPLDRRRRRPVGAG